MRDHMRYFAFATDYDGTLAHDGKVSDAAIAALEKLKKSGRKLLLVTGREMDDILQVFPRLDVFDRVVSENGAVIYRPEDRSEKLLAERPSNEFLNALKTRHVSPLSAGRVIIGSWDTETQKILDAIRQCGLELEIIFNKRSVMVLPTGVNKASGLCAALEELDLSQHDLVAVGDAENDIAMLKSAACAAAVAGALESVKESADVILDRDAGDGVIDLIRRLLENDLRDVPDGHRIEIGRARDRPGI